MATKLIINSQATQDALLAMTVDADVASQNIVRDGGHLIARYAKLNFRGDTSAPPEPPLPTQRTGNTRNSIDVHEVTRVGPGRWMSKTYPTTIYARRLELGGQSRQQVFGQGPLITIVTRPFPYLAPALKEARPELKQIYTLEWEAALNGGRH